LQVRKLETRAKIGDTKVLLVMCSKLLLNVRLNEESRIQSTSA